MTLPILALLACRNGTDPNTDGPVDTQDTGCPAVTLYADQDGDGWGSGEAVPVCQDTPGYVTTAEDCDDTDPSVHPGATDIALDGVDQDCDGADNRDGDGDGDPVDTDCDDSDPLRSTLFFELCDTGVDEDCDGVVDEDCQYFGGIASGTPDHRIEGIWVDDWQNKSHAGQGVYSLPDVDGDGVADIAVAGDTYDERFVHLFSGGDVLSRPVTDFDQALLAVSSSQESAGLSDLVFVSLFERDGTQYLLLQADVCEVFDLSTTSSQVLYWGDGLFGYGDGSCHLELLDESVPTSVGYGSSLVLRNLSLDGESFQLTTIDLDGTRPAWSATDDWTGDGVSEIFVGSHDPSDLRTQRLWHGQGPFEVDTSYASDVMVAHDSIEVEFGQGLDLTRAFNRPDLAEDVNNDGLPDLIVEVRVDDSQRELFVWIDTIQVDLTAPGLRVVNQDDHFGAYNLGTFHLGDINCDGHADLVQTFVEQETLAGLALALGPLGTGTIEIQSEPDGLLAQVGFEDWNQYAAHAAFLDDLNGDGCQELLVGDPTYETDPDRFGPGAAHLFLGAPGAL
ncbi:MAG: putative metal-binding motif-containing protein [Myxococcota bacterium]|nr:putative metal-binding motif-containing protein [Myxococcota bacterium]